MGMCTNHNTHKVEMGKGGGRRRKVETKKGKLTCCSSIVVRLIDITDLQRYPRRLKRTCAVRFEMEKCEKEEMGCKDRSLILSRCFSVSTSQGVFIAHSAPSCLHSFELSNSIRCSDKASHSDGRPPQSLSLSSLLFSSTLFVVLCLAGCTVLTLPGGPSPELCAAAEYVDGVVTPLLLSLSVI